MEGEPTPPGARINPMMHLEGRRAHVRLMVMSLLALSPGCATSSSRPPGPLDGVYAYTAHRGQDSFEGTLSLSPAPNGYQGYLIMPGSDLPLARSTVDGSRVTLVF